MFLQVCSCIKAKKLNKVLLFKVFFDNGCCPVPYWFFYIDYLSYDAVIDYYTPDSIAF